MRTEDDDDPNRRGAIGCVAFGVVSLVMFGYMALEGRATLDWPSVEGTVVESQVVKTRSIGDTGVRGHIVWRPDIMYRYTIDGMQYTGTRRVIAGRSYDKYKPWAEGIVKKYPAGARVRVYHDPEDPSQAVLETGASSNIKSLLIIPVFILIIGVPVLIVILSQRRATAAQRRRIEERRARRQHRP